MPRPKMSLTHCTGCLTPLTEENRVPYYYKRGEKTYTGLRNLCRSCLNDRARVDYHRKTGSVRHFVARELPTPPGPPPQLGPGRIQYHRWLSEMIAEIRRVSSEKEFDHAR